jgi:hypothetical protein
MGIKIKMNHLKKGIIMKKVILSIAILVAAITLIGVQQVNAAYEQPAISMVMQDDGFVEVPLDSLSPAVQASVNALATEYDITSLKFNAEKQITKVKLVKKEDQSEKVVYFDAQGKEVTLDAAPQSTTETTETPMLL